MHDYILQYPVHSIDGKLLLEAGTELTEPVLAELRQKGKAEHFQNIKIMDHKTIRSDINEFIKIPPYDIMFSAEEKTVTVLGIMSNVTVSLPVLQTLDFFKQNDFYTYRHMLMVFAMSVLIGSELVQDHNELHACAMASPAHDLGKFSVPLSILQKSDILSRSERNRLEHHTLAGYVLFQYYMPELEEKAGLAARDHHERRNGNGYPKGIQLQNSHTEIVVVCDLFDALITPRPYRPVSFDVRTALEEISFKADQGELGWNAVKALFARNRRAKPDYLDCRISSERRGQAPEDNNYGLIE